YGGEVGAAEVGEEEPDVTVNLAVAESPASSVATKLYDPAGNVGIVYCINIVSVISFGYCVPTFPTLKVIVTASENPPPINETWVPTGPWFGLIDMEPPCAFVTGIIAVAENNTIKNINAAMANFALQSVGAFFNKISLHLTVSSFPI